MNQKSIKEPVHKQINGNIYQSVISMNETASDTTSIASYNAIIGFRPTLTYVAVMNPYYRLKVEKNPNPKRTGPLFSLICILLVILVVMFLNFILPRAYA